MSNAVSFDFPLRFRNELTNKPPERKEIPQKQNDTHYYNNESPELFRLGSMSENPQGYKNPFLDEVISIDRNEAYKKMDYNRKQIELIDKIKSNPHYSQNPKILRYIRSEFDVSMQDKRERIVKERASHKEDNTFKLCVSEDGNGLFEQKVNQLHKGFSQKMPYKIKQRVDMGNLVPLSENYTIPETDKESFTYLKSDLDPRKSGYLRNLNDYNIKEADNANRDKIVHFKMKDRVAYNLVKDKIETIKPPYAMNEKWDSFHENFVMLIDKEKGFKKKGGLFTEFANKNKCVYDMQTQQRQRDLEKKKTNAATTGHAVMSSGVLTEPKECITETTPISKVSNMSSAMKLKNNNSGNVTQDDKANKLRNSVNQVNNAIKIIEDNNLFKLKNVYMKTSPNHRQEELLN